jgi:hypothetical protein
MTDIKTESLKTTDTKNMHKLYLTHPDPHLPSLDQSAAPKGSHADCVLSFVKSLLSSLSLVQHGGVRILIFTTCNHRFFTLSLSLILLSLSGAAAALAGA